MATPSPAMSAGTDEVIRAEGLTKVYAGGRTAVDHLDLCVTWLPPGPAAVGGRRRLARRLVLALALQAGLR